MNETSFDLQTLLVYGSGFLQAYFRAEDLNNTALVQQVTHTATCIALLGKSEASLHFSANPGME
jgi:hypothetical protein